MNAHHTRLLPSFLAGCSDFPQHIMWSGYRLSLTPIELLSERFAEGEEMHWRCAPLHHAGTQGPPRPNHSWLLASNPIFSFSITSVMNIWPHNLEFQNYFPFFGPCHLYMWVSPGLVLLPDYCQNSPAVAEQLLLPLTTQVGKRRQWTAWDTSVPNDSHKL